MFWISQMFGSVAAPGPSPLCTSGVLYAMEFFSFSFKKLKNKTVWFTQMFCRYKGVKGKN